MEKDLTKKNCLMDNERYADLINGLIFQGKQVLQAEDLLDMDSQTGIWSKFGVRGKWQRKQRYRDLIKKVALGVAFVVIGIENQEEVHYLMPLRALAYDVSEYERQASIIRKKVRRQMGITKAEFLSGFMKESKLNPCITIVLYYGNNWDGSYDLHGILDIQKIPEEMRTYINNYSLHLVEVRKLKNTEVFQTDIKQIFDFIRYSEDKKKLKELIKADPVYQEMDEDAYDMVITYANAEELIKVKKYHGKDGKVNMCKGLQEWMEDERNEGMEQKTKIVVENMLRRGMQDDEIRILADCQQEIIDEVRARM